MMDGKNSRKTRRLSLIYVICLILLLTKFRSYFSRWRCLRTLRLPPARLRKLSFLSLRLYSCWISGTPQKSFNTRITLLSVKRGKQNLLSDGRLVMATPNKKTGIKAIARRMLLLCNVGPLVYCTSQSLKKLFNNSLFLFICCELVNFSALNSNLSGLDSFKYPI